MQKSIFIGLILVATFLGACKKNNGDSGSPSTYVNYELNPSNPAYFNLNAPGGWVYIDGVGVREVAEGAQRHDPPEPCAANLYRQKSRTRPQTGLLRRLRLPVGRCSAIPSQPYRKRAPMKPTITWGTMIPCRSAAGQSGFHWP